MFIFIFSAGENNSNNNTNNDNSNNNSSYKKKNYTLKSRMKTLRVIRKTVANV